MPQVSVVVSPRFARDAERLRLFLRDKNPNAAKTAATAISKAVRRLAQHPESCRPVPESTTLRELVIAFGDSGYVALYEYHPDIGIVTLLTIKHQKEEDYK